jgi:hypothetical protein
MLVTAHRKFKFGSPLTLALPGTVNLIAATQQPLPANKKDQLLSSKIFRVNFHYLQHAVHIKVLKVVYGGGETIYKIVLNSALSKWNNVCWLQRRLQDWVILLGPEPDEKLKLAITSAIECQEFLNLI